MLRAQWFIQVGSGCLFGMSATSGPGLTGVTDGTAAGTLELPVGFDPRRAFLWRDVLYFAGYTTATGSELWRSDGTLAATIAKSSLPTTAGARSPAPAIRARS